jgi:hypothetical protein
MSHALKCSIVAPSVKVPPVWASMSSIFVHEASNLEIVVGRGWIAANELPLVDELIPFLLARSGQALDEFCRWVAPHRPLDWVLTMLECLPMSMPTQEELLWRFGPVEDPEIEARRQRILDFLLETSPQKKQQLMLTATRASLRRVLANRQLTPSKDDDARIEACTDLATLERWLDRASNATSVSDVLG